MLDALRGLLQISIHALREEGDGLPLKLLTLDFNFYPRPPRGGRPEKLTVDRFARAISIHALREEGDSAVRFKTQRRMTFLSTPSARRATRLR